MYSIHEIWPPLVRVPGLSFPYLFDRAELYSDDAQRHLAVADRQHYRIVCHCRKGIELPLHRVQVEARSGCFRYHVARREAAPGEPGTLSHAPQCRHSTGDLGSSLGLEAGVLKRDGDSLVLNLGALFSGADPASDGQGGPGSNVSADYGPRLRALLWLLQMVAGVNSYHPRLRYREFFASLYFAAKGIKLGGAKPVGPSTLADVLLRPDNFDKLRRVENASKLESVAGKRGKRCLMVSLLTDARYLETSKRGDKYLQLFTQLGVSVNIDEQLLRRSLFVTDHIQAWREANRPILALGLVSAVALDAGKGPVVGNVKHLALLPLHKLFVAVPTPYHELMLEKSIEDGEAYGVDAEEDPALKRNSAKT